MLQEPVVREPGTDALLAQTGAGSETAFAALYDRLSPVVFGIGRALLPDVGAAERMTEEAFLTVWRTAVRYEPGGDATAWVLGVVYRTAARHR